MKIYFEDGALRRIPEGCHLKIDAKDGYSVNRSQINTAQLLYPGRVIYTNAPLCFSNYYAWDEEAQAPQIYIRNEKGIFTRIDEMTNRELKQGHNLWRLYEANEFGNL